MLHTQKYVQGMASDTSPGKRIIQARAIFYLHRQSWSTMAHQQSNNIEPTERVHNITTELEDSTASFHGVAEKRHETSPFLIFSNEFRPYE
jgi:hypothetical protein